MKEIAIVMGSKSDMETMQYCVEILEQFGLEFDLNVVSAHRTPERMFEFARGAKKQGYEIIIAAAGGAAHLPGMIASLTTLPVIGVPIQSKALSGMDSLLSIAQMPGGVPVLTMAIGKAGAINAAYAAVSILSLNNSLLSQKYEKYKEDLARTTWENQFQ